MVSRDHELRQSKTQTDRKPVTESNLILLHARGVNAHGTVTLPMPATVILDAARTVRWIDVRPDYSTRTEPQQVIDALDHLAD